MDNVKEKAEEIIAYIKCGRVNKPTALLFIDALIEEGEALTILDSEFSENPEAFWPEVKILVEEFTPEETINISLKEYEDLIDDSLKLSALEGVGVDNWCGWDDAMEAYNEMKKEA